MPKDISSSSSEDEADSPATETPAKPTETGRRSSMYECPADFVPFCHKPCSNTLMQSLKKKHNEIWLIKAPSSFNPESLRGMKVPLSGLQSFKVPTAAVGDQQIYNILASPRCTSDLHLLTRNSGSSNGMVFSQTFSGLLNVCESFGDCSTNQDPHVIPAAPAPSIPPGLKQRFHPFGSKTPTLTCVAEDEADGATFGPSSTTLRPLVAKRFVEDTRDDEEEEDGRKKKKKKKKEKRMKTERGEEEETVRVKEEPVCKSQDEESMEIPFQEDDVSEERRKKKKKKKDREREEVEEGTEPSVRVKTEAVTVKYEPIDTSYGDVVEASGKKKKKKKKNRSEED